MSDPNIIQNVQGSNNIFSATGDVYVYNSPVPLSPDDAKKRRDLKILLERVKDFWINGILKNSLHNVAFLDLNMETREDAIETVASPLQQVLELPDQDNQILTPDKRIIDIFDNLSRGLLILGEPGSGKTITLLELASELIKRAEMDESLGQPIPVIFNLSSWTPKQSLIEWMVEQLLAIYQIPRKIGLQWLNENRLLLLLDGLDEVRQEFQARCVTSLNQISDDFGLAGLVVCSRVDEYTNLPVRLKLNGAICLQPLTQEQISEYLLLAKEQLNALRITLQEDQTLQTLAHSPLNLGIMSLAYKDMSIEELTDQKLDTVVKRRNHLFNTYVEKMLKRKGEGNIPYTDMQFKKWLSWLAQEMEKHNQSIFLLEQLQPSWLPNLDWHWVYYLSSRVITGLIGGLIFTLTFVTLILRLSRGFNVGFSPNIMIGLAFSMFFGPIFGLLVGLGIGLIDILRLEDNDERVKGKQNFRPSVLLIVTLILATASAFVGGVSFGLVGRLISGPGIGLIFGVLFGLVLFGVIVGLRGKLIMRITGNRRTIFNDIQPVESLTWSWSRALKGCILGLLLGLVIGASYEILFWFFSEINLTRLIVGLGYGLIIGLGGTVYGGVVSGVARTKAKPNQGIRLSLRNSLLIGGIAGVLSGLLFGLTVGIGVGLNLGFTLGIMIGLISALLSALLYGGAEIIKHYILRLILVIQGYTSQNYSHFLNCAVERILLQKVGGGYIFVHRLLLEYFASMKILNRS